MAITLGQATTKVRARTRHRQDTRVEDTEIHGFLNEAYRTLRTRLQTIAPRLYLQISAEITFDNDEANEIALADADVNFGEVYRVEKQDLNGAWRPIEKADAVDPNNAVHGRVTYRVEHKCLKLGPDIYTAGTYRVHYHPYPAALTDANAFFQLPQELEQALIYLATGQVLEQDGDAGSIEKFDDLAEKHIAKVSPALRRQQGKPSGTAGLRHVLPY